MTPDKVRDLATFVLRCSIQKVVKFSRDMSFSKMLTLDNIIRQEVRSLQANARASRDIPKQIFANAAAQHRTAICKSQRASLAPLRAVRADKQLEQADAGTLQLIADISRCALCSERTYFCQMWNRNCLSRLDLVCKLTSMLHLFLRSIPPKPPYRQVFLLLLL